LWLSLIQMLNAVTWWRTDTANQRWGSEWEPIKILLEGDGNSNKMNTTSNTCLRLTTQVGQAHVATGVPLDLGTNTQPSDPRMQQNTKPRVHWPTPVRPVKSTGQTCVACAARDEQHPRVNSPKSKPRSPESLHGLEQDFGDNRNTSWGANSQV
jgi:hypothetical protein